MICCYASIGPIGPRIVPDPGTYRPALRVPSAWPRPAAEPVSLVLVHRSAATPDSRLGVASGPDR